MLEVREQAKLSFRRLLSICLDSISYRVFRSLVTVFIILVAIAFLAAIINEGYLGRAARDAVRERTRDFTAFSRFLRRVNTVPTARRMAEQSAHVATNSADFLNLKGWGGFTNEEAESFIAACRQAGKYLAFFDGIPAGRRVLLVRQNADLQIFDWLAQGENYESFAEAIAPMKSLRVPGAPAEFRKFLDGWPAFRERLERVRRAYGDTVHAIADYCAPEDVPTRFARAVHEGKGEPFLAELARRGFHVDAAELPALSSEILFHERLEAAQDILKRPNVRRGWNEAFHETFGPQQALISCAEQPERVDWIARVAGLGADFDKAGFLAVAQEHRRRSRLLEAERRLMTRYGESERLGERTVWLVFVSFLVCTVGIANAMLMSVLERFKEIATMKCLGARNGAIAFLFITESVIMGVVGGLVGVAAGFVIALVRQTVSYGTLVYARFPAGDVLTALAVCMACSLLLTAVASVYPAHVAARMAPMEAMRVD